MNPARRFVTTLRSALGGGVVGCDAEAMRDFGPGEASQRDPEPCGRIPAWLDRWRSLPRHPLWEVADPSLMELIRAAELSLPVRLIYHGGSTPGAARWFTPSLVFQVAEFQAEDEFLPVHVSGWCHSRQAHRILRLDRIQLAGLELAGA
jgi:hypothetical protein